jgi:hypothetical protein
VVVSALENFVEQEVALEEHASKKRRRMQDAVWLFTSELVKAATSRPSSKFAVAGPLARPGNAWMTRNSQGIQLTFDMALGHRQVPRNLKVLDPAAPELLAFDQDGILLAPGSGMKYLSHLLEQSEGWFLEAPSARRECVDREAGLDLATSEEDTLLLQVGALSLGPVGGTLEEAARNSEEADRAANCMSQHSTLVFGLVDRSGLPEERREEEAMLRCLALQLCREVKPEFQGEVVSAFLVNRDQPGRLAFRFRLESGSQAREIRKLFQRLSSDGNLPPGLARVVLSPVRTTGTQVRLEILEAIARKLSVQGREAFVMSGLPQPLLFCASRGVASSFVQTVAMHGHLLQRSDLWAAYRRAGRRFVGEMQQNFLVLEDTDCQQEERSPRAPGRWAEKRRRDHRPDTPQESGTIKRRPGHVSSSSWEVERFEDRSGDADQTRSQVGNDSP